jgi:gamma-glutamyl-gamma-aminobutyrate hydrolase PuuD
VIKRPLIGVDCSSVIRDGADAPAIALTTHFTTGIDRAGGAPVIIPPRIDLKTLDSIFPVLDGLLLSGGADLSPESHGKEADPLLRSMSDNRGELALYLARRAIEEEVPILGVCLGCQVINVVCGGSILMDIHSIPHPQRIKHKYNFSPDFTEHEAALVEDSDLCNIMGGSRQIINSCHHQAIDQPGDGLRVTATAPDGIIEAIESVDGGFVIGVQWHPEYLLNRAEHFALFEALICAAGNHRINNHAKMSERKI